MSPRHPLPCPLGILLWHLGMATPSSPLAKDDVAMMHATHVMCAVVIVPLRLHSALLRHHTSIIPLTTALWPHTVPPSILPFDGHTLALLA